MVNTILYSTVAAATIATCNSYADGVATNRLLAATAHITLAQVANPTIANIQTYVQANLSTLGSRLIRYTGTNTASDIATYLFVSDSSGVVSQIAGGLKLPSATTAQLIGGSAIYPAASYVGVLFNVSDGDGGTPCLAISNGTTYLKIPILNSSISSTGSPVTIVTN